MAPARPPLPERIVDAALARADRVGWSRVRLHDVAADLDLRLVEIYRLFPDLDAVGDALFARADRAMLNAARGGRLDELPPRERLHRVMMAWFETLDPHRSHVRAILRYKFAFAHIHLRAALVVRLSRTVQWIREAAGLDADGLRHDVEEIGLSALLVATVLYWLSAPADALDTTRAFLERRLECADRAMTRLWPPAGRCRADAPAGATR